MKKIIFTLISAMIMCTSMAQTTDATNKANKPQRRNHAEMVAKRTQEMTEKYALSKEQAEKVKALNEKYMGRHGSKGQRPEMKKGQRPEPPKDGNMNNKGHREGEPRGGQRPNMEEYNKELKAIMNDTQYKAYTADVEKMKKERKAKQKKD